MDTLFPLALHLPQGFEYYPDFIDAGEEAMLLQEIASTELHTFLFQVFESKRRVASVGYTISSGIGNQLAPRCAAIRYHCWNLARLKLRLSLAAA